ALHGNLLDGVRHVLPGDAKKAVRTLFRRAPVADLRRNACEAAAHRIHAKRLVLCFPEYVGEVIRQRLPHHPVGFGTAQRPATSSGVRPSPTSAAMRVKPPRTVSRSSGWSCVSPNMWEK